LWCGSLPSGACTYTYEAMGTTCWEPPQHYLHQMVSALLVDSEVRLPQNRNFVSLSPRKEQVHIRSMDFTRQDRLTPTAGNHEGGIVFEQTCGPHRRNSWGLPKNHHPDSQCVGWPSNGIFQLRRGRRVRIAPLLQHPVSDETNGGTLTVVATQSEQTDKCRC
jgi:hypothetical protein